MNIRLFSFFATLFSMFIVTTYSFAQDNNFEFRGKYNQALQCGAYMGNFTILAQKINDDNLEAAFEAATERFMKEAIDYGEKLNLSHEQVVDELKKLAASIDQTKSSYSEREIASMTQFCAPEILPLLE